MGNHSLYLKALQEVVASLMRRAHLPRPLRNIDPFENEELLALIDISRAIEAGCKTPKEVIAFLHIEDEGWFFENRVRTKAELALLSLTWNRVLEKEGLPEELGPLPGLGNEIEELEEQKATPWEDDFFAEKISEKAFSLLSKLEKDVFRLTMKGLGRRRIAKLLGLSPNTIKEVKRRIRQKLGKK